MTLSTRRGARARPDRHSGSASSGRLSRTARRGAGRGGASRMRATGGRPPGTPARRERVADRGRGAGPAGADRNADAEDELRNWPAASSSTGPRHWSWRRAEREALEQRIQRLARRREQLGPVNPLAQQEYEDALEHVEELERQREDLETALRELDNLIRDTDKQIRETFEQTFSATARYFEELAERLFPGGRGRLSLVNEREGQARVLGGQSPDEEGSEGREAQEPSEEDEEDILGVEIEITPAGKEMKRLSLLSGGEKSMTALAFLFAVFLARPCPFLHPRRGRSSARRPQHRSLPRPVAVVLGPGPIHRRHAPEAHRWRPLTRLTACRWAPTASRR